MKVLLSGIVFLLMSFGLKSQSHDTPVRIEIEARSEVFDLLPCNDQGVLVFYETINQADHSKKLWFFVFYNTWLEPIWSRELPIFNGLTYQTGKISGNTAYLTFLKSQKTRSEEYNFQLIKINLTNSEAFIYSFNLPDRLEVINFHISDSLFIGAFNYSRDQASVVIRNLYSGTEKNLLFEENPSFIKDLCIDEEKELIWVVSNIYLTRKQSTTFIQAYNFNGEFIQNIPVITPESNFKITNPLISLGSDHTSIYLAGTYNLYNGKTQKNDSRDKTEPVEGFFIARFENGEQKFFNNYRIDEFENFTQIFNNQQLAIYSSTFRRQSRKGSDFPVDFNLLLHPLKNSDDQIIIAADAYFPVYRQISTMSYDFYGRPIPYYYTVFDGYRYYNTFVAGFSKDGELKWTNGMKLWDIRSSDLRRQTDLFIDNSQIVIFYNHEGKIVSRSFIHDVDVGTTENLMLSLMNPGDMVVENSNGTVVHWYNNYFLASGYQIIQNPSAGGNRKKVFYVNKVALD